MTQFLIDIASYQRGINLDIVRDVGFTLVNVKTSQGNHYTFSDAVSYARAAHERGMGVACFHWLDNSASGAAQADYCWRTLRQVIGAVGPVALQVDNEDPERPATWAITRDFVRAIADKMGHLPFMYTGDWWAAGRPSWDVRSLTPWLMAAPNAGYPGIYPGDESAHWHAGYWGYDNLSLMQYAVSPIANAGGGNISKAAIRDPALWAALTGGEDDMTPEQAATLGRIDQRITALFYGMQTNPYGSGQMKDEPNQVRKQLDRIEASTVDTTAIVAAVVTAVGGLNVDIADADIERITAALKEAPDVPLGEDDMPAIEGALRNVLRGV